MTAYFVIIFIRCTAMACRVFYPAPELHFATVAECMASARVFDPAIYGGGAEVTCVAVPSSGSAADSPASPTRAERSAPTARRSDELTENGQPSH